MKLLKWVLIGCGAMVVVFAGALAFIAATFDPNQYKGQVADLVKQKTQRTLAIEGDIRLMLFPKLGVELGKTRLSEFRSDREFAGLDEMRVSLALIPLLSKQVVVDQIHLDGLRVNLVKHKDGGTNFDDLLGQPSEAKAETAPAEPSPSAQSPIKLDIDGISVNKAAVLWRDEAAGAEYSVTGLDLKTGRVAIGVPTKFELAALIKANQPKAEVKLQAAGTLFADPEKKVFSLTAFKLDVAGAVGNDTFNAKASAPKIELNAGNLSVAELVASVKAQAPQLDASLGVTLSGVEGSAKAVNIARLSIDVDAKQADNAVKGRLSTPINANLETQVFELPKLAGEFDLTSPVLPMKTLKLPLSGQVTADLKMQAVNAALALKFDESNIDAKLGTKNFAVPFHSFDIAIDKLNVDKYLPPKKQEAAAPAPAPAAGAQPEQPIDFSPIKKLNLAGSVRIGDLVASNVKVQNLRIDVKAKDGRLDVNPLSAKLYEGAVNGSLSVNANNNQLAIKQNLSGIAIGPLLRDALKHDLLEGRGNVALDVSAVGNTVTAIKKALNGTARLDLKDGAIKGINLAQSLRNARSMFTGGTKESEQAAVNTEKTDFSELTASFVIRNGVARNNDFLAKSPFLRLTGEGEIDIAGGSLNYLAKATVVATSAGQGGKEAGDLRGLTIPVRASGPFTALKYKLDFGSALAGSAKQQIEEKKEALKGKLEDKLKSKLLGGAQPEGAAATEGTPPKKPEDQLKEKLKKLF